MLCPCLHPIIFGHRFVGDAPQPQAPYLSHEQPGARSSQLAQPDLLYTSMLKQGGLFVAELKHSSTTRLTFKERASITFMWHFKEEVI